MYQVQSAPEGYGQPQAEPIASYGAPAQAAAVGRPRGWAQSEQAPAASESERPESRLGVGIRVRNASEDALAR